jgi:hypothetical protein
MAKEIYLIGDGMCQVAFPFSLLSVDKLKPLSISPVTVVEGTPRPTNLKLKRAVKKISSVKILSNKAGANAGNVVTGNLSNLINNGYIQEVAKASKIYLFLEEKLSPYYLKARHLNLVLRMFEELGSVSKTELFGTYRVELVVILFTRILDLHNFELVLQCLTPYEVGCIYCRIGWLKLYNPMKPEGSYALDIGRTWEERQVLKMMCGLEVHEPGENWPSQSFRWDDVRYSFYKF